jgi:eukaryotic-like serine/threonine-protein kinase
MTTLEEAMITAGARVGQVIAGKYVLEGVLGVGGMGAVYRARHAVTDRHVALKLLHADRSRAPGAAQRFLREAKAPAAIRHPAIVETFDAGLEPNGEMYLALELLEGEDLGTALLDRKLSDADIVRIARDVLEVLGVAHEKGFIHRDVKPANIFLTRDAQVKLLDFGIAYRDEGGARVTQAGAILGTPMFMSPEQMCGEPIDPRADLWSVGVVLYFGLTERLPFEGTSIMQILAHIATQGVRSLRTDRPDLPKALLDLVDRTLTRERRISSAKEMAKILSEEVLPCWAPAPRTPSIAPPIHASRPTPKPRERPPWERALLGLQSETERLKKRQSDKRTKPR